METTWIPTKKQMPDRNVWVLVCGPKWLWAGIGQWDGQHWQQDAGQVINDLICDDIDWSKDIDVKPYKTVTHWMPLPPVHKEPTR